MCLDRMPVLDFCAKLDEIADNHKKICKGSVGVTQEVPPEGSLSILGYSFKCEFCGWIKEEK